MNKWVHFAFTFKDGYIYSFIDGKLVNTLYAPYEHYETNYIWINSARLSYRVMTGMIDEFRISSKARWTESFLPPDSEYMSYVYRIFDAKDGFYGRRD